MLRDITIGQHFPGNSLVHRFDPRLKLVLTILYIVLLFAASNPLGLALSLIFLAAMYAVAKIPFKLILKSLKPIFPIIVFTAVLNLFFVSGEGDPVFKLGFLTVYAEGIRYAVLMAVRVMALIAGTSLLTYTTSPIVLTDAIEQLLKPLGRLHFPVHELAMMMSIALRFIPTLIEETDKIMNAQKARGAQLDNGKMTERIKALVPVLVPLFISAFRRADELAMAMECRCYRGGDGRTRLKVLRCEKQDYIDLAVCIAAGTVAMLEGLPVISRKKIFYKGKEVEEMDLDAILQLHPELVIVDELAHTNIEGSRNEKRWQDVMELLDAGINVISAVNIQHIESLNEDVKGIAGIEVKERIPDKVLQDADEVVNIDLTAEELINRLKAGKIYRPEKIQLALNNFFKTENILQLRELALKEVAFRVEKKVENEIVTGEKGIRHEKFLACISSNERTPRHIIRKAARLASRYNTVFFALYVQTPAESTERIPLATQRHLLNHFKLVTELGGEVIQVSSSDIMGEIIKTCRQRGITTVCMGHPAFKMPGALFSLSKYRKFLHSLAEMDIDLIILA